MKHPRKIQHIPGEYLRSKTRSYLIDPADVDVPSWLNFRVIKEVASKGVAVMRDELLKAYA